MKTKGIRIDRSSSVLVFNPTANHAAAALHPPARPIDGDEGDRRAWLRVCVLVLYALS